MDKVTVTKKRRAFGSPKEADDSLVYAYLSKTRPEGKVMLNKQEQKEFEDWLGLNKY